VLWTLSVELTFYLALPLFLEAWRRSPRVGWVYLIGAAVASWAASHTLATAAGWNDTVSLSVVPYFWVFCIGIFIRLLWPHIEEMFQNKFFFWLALHVAVCVTSYIRGITNDIGFHDVYADGGIHLLVVTGLIFSFAFTKPKPNLLRGFDISYGVYLYHMLVIYFMIDYGLIGRLRFWPIVFGGAIIAGTLSWCLVEHPFINLRQMFIARSKRRNTSNQPAAPTPHDDLAERRVVNRIAAI
jgi:peptidoglycan/LPS O-acetylase OafA/YrhL